MRPFPSRWILIVLTMFLWMGNSACKKTESPSPPQEGTEMPMAPRVFPGPQVEPPNVPPLPTAPPSPPVTETAAGATSQPFVPPPPPISGPTPGIPSTQPVTTTTITSTSMPATLPSSLPSSGIPTPGAGNPFSSALSNLSSTPGPSGSGGGTATQPAASPPGDGVGSTPGALPTVPKTETGPSSW